jgi:hypothetical protein
MAAGEGGGEWQDKPEMDTARQWAGLCSFQPSTSS